MADDTMKQTTVDFIAGNAWENRPLYERIKMKDFLINYLIPTLKKCLAIFLVWFTTVFACGLAVVICLKILIRSLI